MSEVVHFPPKGGAPKAALRILVADDHADTLLTLATLLAEEGHAVRTLQDGASVKELVHGFDPDVCILDIEMPGKDSFILARELRERRIEERPMLIAISGVWIRPSDRFLAIMVGFDHFFQKPADPASLLKVLEEYREGRRPRSLEERVHLSNIRS
jgi:chemosensory pili system protein ChpA (sensor histidine kinase/response regulator)